jgi:hypothetical protein
MTEYRKLVYENSRGERVDLTVPFKSFLYELEGMGFSYENDILETNYTDRLAVDSTRLNVPPISGNLLISDLLGNNAKIYEVEAYIAGVLNYDQLVRKSTGDDASGKLFYTNARGVEVYSPVLIKNFSFGEIEEDEGQKILEVDIQFDRLSKTWLSVKPRTILISMEGSNEAHYHPYNHPWSHGEVFAQGNGEITNIGGNDLAKFILSVNGEVSEFQLALEHVTTGDIKTIKFDRTLLAGESLVINNFELSARIGGANAVAYFDFIDGDVPFFDLMPESRYKVTVSSPVLRGSVSLEVYESWVSAP